MPLRTVSLDQLVIDDESAFAGVALYPRLKEVLRRSGHRFLIPAGGAPATWDRVLFLNLTYWNGEAGANVLIDEHLAADVVTHIAWHHIVGTRLAEAGAGRTASAMLFGEAIASAFDLYMLGRLWEAAPESEFVTTQVPIMSEAAQDAGMSDDDFAALMTDVAARPDRAFEELRALLFEVTTALFACGDASGAQLVLERFDGHRLAPLLHHYQLSNWILYARAYAKADPAQDEIVRGFDAKLRAAPVALDWLTANWV
jgi:hypothetical protein